MDSTFYLAHNINQKTLKGGKARTVTNSVFKADFDPPFPNIETPFIATKRIYASLSESAFSLMGIIPYPETHIQFSFVVPCSTEDGTHQIVEYGKGVSAVFMTSYAGLINIEKGEIKFKRYKLKNTIEAIFSVYIKYKHEEEETEEYHAKGKFFMSATGPLCVEGQSTLYSRKSKRSQT